jgi:hypothetical protein
MRIDHDVASLTMLLLPLVEKKYKRRAIEASSIPPKEARRKLQ